MKILYIVGSGRSGTTILDNILGQLPESFSTGETRYIWDRGLIEGRQCGCGLELYDCEIWSKILDQMSIFGQDIDAQAMVAHRDRIARTRHFPALMLPFARQRLVRSAQPYLEATHRLYRCIGSVTKARVIIDSSKWPAYGEILRLMFGDDVYFLHFVRDPRAVSYSWKRLKAQPDSPNHPHMRRMTTLGSSLIWLAWNVSAEVIGMRSPDRYLRIRYEDLIEAPADQVNRILKFIGSSSSAQGLVNGRTVKLSPNHTVSGNPSRFKTGEVELRLDNEWETGMRFVDRLASVLITWPLMIRYGYSPRSRWAT